MQTEPNGHCVRLLSADAGIQISVGPLPNRPDPMGKLGAPLEHLAVVDDLAPSFEEFRTLAPARTDAGRLGV